MRSMVYLAVLVAAASALSGCAVVEVAGDAVSAGATVATTTVDVAAGVAGTAADTIGGSTKDDKKPN